MPGDDEQFTTDERMSSFENKLAGVIQGQNSMRQNVEHGFNEIKLLIAQKSDNQPLRVVEWTLIVLAATNLLIVITGIVVMYEYLTAG